MRSIRSRSAARTGVTILDASCQISHKVIIKAKGNLSVHKWKSDSLLLCCTLRSIGRGSGKKWSWMNQEGRNYKGKISGRERNMQKLYIILLTYSIKQRPESHTVTHTWHASKYKVHKLRQRYILFIKLLCLCDVFRALINSLVVLILHERSRPRSVADCNLLQT